MSLSKVGVVLVAAWATLACSPTFDWRDARPAEGLTALFPCKPETHARRVVIAGEAQQMGLSACSAGELTFAVAQVEARDVTRITPLLQALREALAANVAGADAGGGEVQAADAPLQGAQAHPLAQRLSVSGRRADGSSFHAQGQFFCKGLRVYQVTVVGTRLDAQALDVFFSSLKLST